MARTTAANELSKLIADLRAQRQEHMEAIEQIDRTFETFGIDPDAAPGNGRRGPGRKKKTRTQAAAKKTGRKKTGKRGGRRRKRGTFKTTAEESVLAFVKKHGKPNAAEVNDHWAKEGRGGKANNTLTKLVKEGKLKRVAAKGERGGRYTAA